MQRWEEGVCVAARRGEEMQRLQQWSLASKPMDAEPEPEPEEEDFYMDVAAEEEADFPEPADLRAALKQKQEELLLAAELGNALLLDNRQLKEHQQKLHDDFADKLEELEQSRHELRVKLEGRCSEWESQVGDLERELGELRDSQDQLTTALAHTQRDKKRAQREAAELALRLQDQLNTAMEVEKAMSGELQKLKEELQQKGKHNRSQDEELISAMREQVLRLEQKERALEERLETVCRENAELMAKLASLHTQLARQEQLAQHYSQQLAEARQEVEAARSRSQELQAQVEELQEEEAGRSHRDTSLLAELETSMDVTAGASREEITQEMGSILELLLPLTHKLAPQVERSEVGERAEELPALLHQLRGVAQTLAGASGPQELNQAFVERSSDQGGNPSTALELRDQNQQLQQENAEMRRKLQGVQEQAEAAQQAIRDRDEAIAKKNLMEAELVRSKNDMMCLNNQLLEAIQRKLELSQELEDWKDDIQIIIDQQLRTQQQSEQQKKPPPNGTSFFRRPSRTPSTWTRQASNPSSWGADSPPDRVQSIWKDWLRRARGHSVTNEDL